MADLRIAYVGDSQGEALFPRLEKRLAQALGLAGTQRTLTTVLSRAQRGWSERNYQTDNTLPAQLAEARPDVVIIGLGGNNSVKDTARYLATVRWVLDAAREAGAAQIIWLGPAAATKEPFKSNKEWTRSAQSTALSAESDVVWVDMFPFTGSGHATDGVHFVMSHYDKWATQLAKSLSSVFSKATASQAQNKEERADDGGNRGVWAAVGIGVLALVSLGFAIKRVLRPSRKPRPLITNR